MKKQVIVSYLISAIVLACGLSVAVAETKVTVLLDWFVNPDHGPLYVALEKGFFKEKGLEVEFIAPSNPNDPPKLVAAKKADLAVSYQNQHHLQVDQGLPLVRVATLVATPLNSLVVLEEGPVKTLADLKGRVIGYSVGGFETLFVQIMLSQAGLTMDDVKLVNVNFSLSPSLLSGKVDAVIGAFRNFELNQMALLRRPGRAFYVEEQGIPSYDELILICHADRVSDPVLGSFVDALEQGVQYMVNHPKESWNLFVRGRSDLDDELNRLAWRDTLPRFALRPGALDHSRYRRFAEFLKKRGMIEKIPPLSSYAVELAR